MIETLVNDAVTLLQRLIATPSISRDETAAADILQQTIESYGYKPERLGNNIWIKSPQWDDNKPLIILNAHIDTVKPVATWTRDPFTPTIEGDRLYGLGSNDCGGGLVSLLQVFRHLTATTASPAATAPSATSPSATAPSAASPSAASPSAVASHVEGGASAFKAPLPFNLLYLASCEEEVSGINGIRLALPRLQEEGIIPVCQHSTGESPSSMQGEVIAIVGEPTGMQPAIAERGLMVIDGVAHGKSGHAARNEGINAIYQTLDDLVFIRDYQFRKVSELLGPTKMQCTVVNSGTQHNVVPDECKFIIDVRTNEHYTNEEVFDFLKTKLKSDITARSFHLHSSSISPDHPLIKRCLDMGMQPFGSPTLSDQALMRFPSFKLGPGQSSRSHSADEFICISEIRDAITKYLQLLS